MQSQCEHYNVHQFASFCYIPVKLVSQLLHLHNIYNATKELLTVRSLHDIFQINKLVKQAGLGELSLDCRSPSQRVKLQIMLSMAATLVFLVLTGFIKHPTRLSASPIIELVAGVFLMYIQSYYY